MPSVAHPMPMSHTRVSNPFTAFDDGTGLSFGHHTGSSQPFGPGHKTQFALGLGSQFGPVVRFIRHYDFGQHTGSPVRAKSSGPGQDFKGEYPSLGLTSNILSNGSTSNCVEFASSLGYGRELRISGGDVYNASGSSVLW